MYVKASVAELNPFKSFGIVAAIFNYSQNNLHAHVSKCVFVLCTTLYPFAQVWVIIA